MTPGNEGKLASELINYPDDLNNLWLEKFAEAKELQEPVIFEARGGVMYKNIWCCVSHLDGDKFSFLVQDISKQKELEETLTQNQAILEKTVRDRTHELEEALNVKSRFLAVISHGK